SPGARGQGIGGRTYRAFAAQAASGGASPMFYEWIHPGNASSIAMFAKLGFKKDTLVTDCYARKE
ncbi:MAG: GNAT family N-acetyltransferase, partial [Defluviitaleaceae bacterium]|nr:GNAT family N-acetyltransferase [Defluviitaleaceae bacterium]